MQADVPGNLIPALSQTFSIIFLGFISYEAFGKKGQRALELLVTRYALPCTVMIGIASIDFSRVSWVFVVAVFVAKTFTFCVTVAVTVMTSSSADMKKSASVDDDAMTAANERTQERKMAWKKAAIRGMFTTLSNDFALGVPIFSALFSPEYVSYIYLVAPITLVLLNPVAFVLMELNATNDDDDDDGMDAIMTEEEEQLAKCEIPMKVKVILDNATDDGCTIVMIQTEVDTAEVRAVRAFCSEEEDDEEEEEEEEEEEQQQRRRRRRSDENVAQTAGTRDASHSRIGTNGGEGRGGTQTSMPAPSGRGLKKSPSMSAISSGGYQTSAWGRVLHKTMRVLDSLSLNVVNATIHNDANGKALDVLHVQQYDGSKVLDADELEKMKHKLEAVLTCRAPIPKAMLTAGAGSPAMSRKSRTPGRSQASSGIGDGVSRRKHRRVSSTGDIVSKKDVSERGIREENEEEQGQGQEESAMYENTAASTKNRGSQATSTGPFRKLESMLSSKRFMNINVIGRFVNGGRGGIGGSDDNDDDDVDDARDADEDDEFDDHDGKSRDTASCSDVWRVFVKVLATPVVTMAVLGVVVNLVATHGQIDMIPQVVLFPIQNMGNAYSALALFALGLSLASLPAPSSENGTNSTSSMSITPSASAAQASSTLTTRKIIPFSVAELRLVSFLVAMKSFLVPFICMQACFIFSGDPDLGVAAFMYGVLPTAPSVSLFASIYRIGNDVKIIPAATLAGTCAVPPLVYLGARLLMIAVRQHQSDESGMT